MLLRWRDYLASDNLQDHVNLAETIWIGDLIENIEIEVTVGRTGFPNVVLNGRSLPKSDWTLSKEAREFVVTNVEQLFDVYAGRIGVMHHGGTTTVKKSQLRYLSN